MLRMCCTACSKAQLFGLEQYKEAFAAAKQGMRSHKVLFSMQQ